MTQPNWFELPDNRRSWWAPLVMLVFPASPGLVLGVVVIRKSIESADTDGILWLAFGFGAALLFAGLYWALQAWRAMHSFLCSRDLRVTLSAAELTLGQPFEAQAFVPAGLERSARLTLECERTSTYRSSGKSSTYRETIATVPLEEAERGSGRLRARVLVPADAQPSDDEDRYLVWRLRVHAARGLRFIDESFDVRVVAAGDAVGRTAARPSA